MFGQFLNLHEPLSLTKTNRDIERSLLQQEIQLKQTQQELLSSLRQSAALSKQACELQTIFEQSKHKFHETLARESSKYKNDIQSLSQKNKNLIQKIEDQKTEKQENDAISQAMIETLRAELLSVHMSKKTQSVDIEAALLENQTLQTKIKKLDQQLRLTLQSLIVAKKDNAEYEARIRHRDEVDFLLEETQFLCKLSGV
jgi:hypothetical protein